MLTAPIKFLKEVPSLTDERVCLVIPPSPFLLDERVFINLGVLKVAASLERLGVNVQVLDLSGVANYLDALTTYLKSSKVSWIGITCTTPQLPNAVSIAIKIREILPKQTIVLGGPHVTLTYSAVKIEISRGIHDGRAARAAKLLETYFDHLVSGDGDIICQELFRPDCPRFLDGDDHKSSYFMSDDVYDQSPMPARHLVDISSYKYSIDNHKATSLIAQLGCPFQCGFCGGRNSKSLRLIRNRSENSIIQEIRHLHTEHGFTGFMFYDDELNVSKTFTNLLSDLIKLQSELNTEFRFRGFIKAELFNELQAELMYKAGFRWILSGFEAAHPRILRNIDKQATIQDNENVVALCKKHGLKIKALMSVGHPGETRESVLAIRDWLIRMDVDDFDCTIITTYPGTPYYDLAIEEVEGSGIWTYTHRKSLDKLHAYEIDHTKVADFYKGDPNGGYKSYVFTDNVTAKELVELRDLVESDVRSALNIPFNHATASVRYEHSMGQGLPLAIFKESLNY